MTGKNDSDFGNSASFQKLRKRVENDLRKSEQEKIAILDSLMEHVIYHDREMRILWANSAACESVHMKREDLIGRNCYEVWSDRRSPCEDCPVIKARETGRLQMAEKMTPDGRWWYIQAHSVGDSNGHVAGTTEIALDITERKRAEGAVRKAKDELEIKVEERTTELAEAVEKLRQEIEVRKKTEKELQASEMLLSSTFDALQDLVIVIDNDLRVVTSNWKDHAYISEKERQENPYCYTAFMQRKTPCEDCHTREVFATGEIKVFEQTNPLDGQTREIQVVPIFDGRKKVAMVVEHLRNITERKRAEKALIGSEFRYRELFNHMSNGVAVYQAVDNGEDFIIVDLNKAGERIDHLKREDLIGKSLLEMYPGVQKFGLSEVLERVWRTGKAEYHPVSFYQDGRISGWRENYVYRLPSGEIVSVFEDISDQKQAEEQIRSLSRQLIKAQEDERQMISRELHDRVAQDLSTLKIGLDTLYHNEQTVSPDVQKKILEFSKIIQNPIRAVRDLSYELHLPGLNGMGLIPALSMYCEEFAEKSGLKVDFLATGVSALRLNFDTEMNLYRLIQEGLNNIRKHAAASLATVKLVGAYPNIILRIEDDGKGFDLEERARTADSEKRMGLRSMAERVSLMQGEMTIQSQPMKGTQIIIKFPFQENKRGSKENHIDR